VIELEIVNSSDRTGNTHGNLSYAINARFNDIVCDETSDAHWGARKNQIAW
jgi:hypothetical protein